MEQVESTYNNSMIILEENHSKLFIAKSKECCKIIQCSKCEERSIEVQDFAKNIHNVHKQVCI